MNLYPSIRPSMKRARWAKWTNWGALLTLFAVAQMANETQAEEPPQKSKVLQDGKPAPDFRLRALDGAMVKLSDLAYPGKERGYAPKRPVFLDFFRTDCQPCLNAMPELVALHEKYSARGLHVLVIALLEEQDGRGKLERYLAKQKLPFAVAVDANQLFAKRYLGDVVTLPATFLIDREGRLKKSKYGASGTYLEYFGDEIDKVLSEHTPAPQKSR